MSFVTDPWFDYWDLNITKKSSGSLSKSLAIVREVSLDLLIRGPKKIKHIHYRFPSHGGFPIGKITNHLKQNPVSHVEKCPGLSSNDPSHAPHHVTIKGGRPGGTAGEGRGTAASRASSSAIGRHGGMKAVGAPVVPESQKKVVHWWKVEVG